MLKCLLHPANTRSLTCAGCLAGVQSRLAERAVQYETRMAAFRQGEALRKHREELRQLQKDEAHKSEYLMDQTTWGEWKKSLKLPAPRRQIDFRSHRIRLANQAESMRNLREHRKRSLDIWGVYKSDMYPRHFRRAIEYSRNQRPAW